MKLDLKRHESKYFTTHSQSLIKYLRQIFHHNSKIIEDKTLPLFFSKPIATMKFSNFALAAVAIAASSAHAFSTPKFAVHQVRIDSTTDDKDIVE